MEEAIALVNRVIREHKQLIKDARNLEHIANDIGALRALDRTTQDFMPKPLGDQKQSLQNLHQSLQKVDEGLKAHFEREEYAVLATFERLGKRTFASALRALLIEHQGIKDRMAKAKQDTVELTSGGSSREIWEGLAYGLRAYIRHTRKLLQAHAKSEEELLLMARKELKGA